ncbi:MAG: arginine repressor [Calditrichaeota bacterium]|nr:MAG: arginine repressor [Calditrichota bacterium]
MAKKKERQYAIKQIIQDEHISNQAELLARLQARGYNTTQATLSRDLHEMGIIRKPTPEGYRYVIAEREGNHAFVKLVGMEILGIYSNENLVVVKTINGRAKGVAIFIDQLKHRNILATIAGENAILIVPDSAQNIPVIKEAMENIACQRWS